MKLMTQKKQKKVIDLLLTLDKRVSDVKARENPEEWYIMCGDIFYQLLELIAGPKAVQAFIQACRERQEG